MLCHNCGASIGEECRFCPSCGAKTLLDAETPPAAGAAAAATQQPGAAPVQQANATPTQQVETAAPQPGAVPAQQRNAAPPQQAQAALAPQVGAVPTQQAPVGQAPVGPAAFGAAPPPPGYGAYPPPYAAQGYPPPYPPYYPYPAYAQPTYAQPLYIQPVAPPQGVGQPVNGPMAPVGAAPASTATGVPAYQRRAAGETAAQQEEPVEEPQREDSDRPLTFWQVVGCYLALFFLPVGNIIFACVWGYRNGEHPQRRTMARAALPFITLGLLVLFGLLMWATLHLRTISIDLR